MEMIHCVQEVIDSLISAVEQNLTDRGKDLRQVSITTDDLIPLISYIITRIDLKYFESSLYYIENFIFTNISSTQLMFNLINFRAGIMFLRGNNLPEAPEPVIDIDAEYNMTNKRILSSNMRSSSQPSRIMSMNINRTQMLKNENLTNSSPGKSNRKQSMTTDDINLSAFVKPPEVIYTQNDKIDLSHIKNLSDG